MPASLRCKLTGCDLDPCGICRRCGDQSKAEHLWQETERERPCFRRKVCERCQKVKEQPEHLWETIDENLKCSRCGLAI